MAFFMDGFDYYSAPGDNNYPSSGAAATTVGSGAFSYGRAMRINAFSGYLTRTFLTIKGGSGGSTANWPTIYAGMHYKVNSFTNTRIVFFDVATAQCSISWNGSGNMIFSRGDRSVTLGTGVPVWPGGFVWLTFKLVMNNGAGSFKCYANEVLQLDLSGLDNCATANNYATDMQWSAGSLEQDIDNLHIFDGADPAPYNAILTERRIRYQLPTGNGTLQDWTASAGSAYACVDENPPNGDTDYIAAATVSNRSTFTFPAFSGMGSIDAVNVGYTAKKDDAGTRKLKSVVRNSGGTVALGPERTMTTAYLNDPAAFLTDPIAGGAWSLSNLNGYQYGVEVSA